MDKKMRFGCVLIMGMLIGITGCGSPEKESESKMAAQAPEIPSQQLSAQKIFVEMGQDNLSGLAEGDEFSVTSPDTSVSLNFEVRRIQESMPGILSISAFVEDEETGQAALLLRDERLSGRIDLFKENIRYRMAYDSTEQQHYLQQVNPDSLDELEGGEPLIPERETADY